MKKTTIDMSQVKDPKNVFKDAKWEECTVDDYIEVFNKLGCKNE